MKFKKKGTFLFSDSFRTYKWLLSFLTPYKLELFILILCGLLISVTNLLVPKVIQYSIDNLLTEEDISKFYLLLMTLIILILLVILIAIPKKNISQRKLQEYCSRDLQLHVVRHLRRLDIQYYEKNSSGKILSLLSTEVRNVQQLYNWLLPLFIQELIFSVLSFIILLTISIELTLITVPTLLIYYLFGPHIEKKASLSGKNMSDTRIKLNQKINESIDSITEMKVNGSPNWSMEVILSEQQKFNKSMVLTYFYAFLRGSIRRVSYYAGGIVLILTGFYLIKNNSISLGAFVAFFLYYFNAMHKITSVITFITEQKVLMYQAKNLFEFCHEKTRFKEDDQAIENGLKSFNKIEFKNVNFSYISDQPVLCDFNLSIKKGDRIAIVGKSGIGKTTIFKLLLRAYDPDSGLINIDGKPINEFSVSSLREFIGYVPQETYLFGSSVFENIRFGNSSITEEQIIEASKKVEAHEFISKLPYGYNTLIGERGIKLSGGQKQRISLARMLVKEPKIMLMDEATASLDSTTETDIYSSLENLWIGKTVITIAHRISSIKKFDKIIVLDEGKIVECGNFDELVRKQGTFTKIIKQQQNHYSEV
ncbi:ABC transporter ATP-binding protein [Bacillus sp. FSL R5-0654]|uniref:ABC transporter ATP-binding protein n=1 Tax=Bacillus TaxID=1386 RepID=UPI0006A896D1|nr:MULTISPECIES: ABC transporter ATP-binding protein [Bacillus]WNF51257.1 ABC transporter ATP-binding protein [Bacillus sp. SG20001]CUB19114.1 Putative multidrug export ATP-binding/permease protein [Bacillus safensis]